MLSEHRMGNSHKSVDLAAGSGTLGWTSLGYSRALIALAWHLWSCLHWHAFSLGLSSCYTSRKNSCSYRTCSLLLKRFICMLSRLLDVTSVPFSNLAACGTVLGHSQVCAHDPQFPKNLWSEELKPLLWQTHSHDGKTTPRRVTLIHPWEKDHINSSLLNMPPLNSVALRIKMVP